ALSGGDGAGAHLHPTRQSARAGRAGGPTQRPRGRPEDPMIEPLRRRIAHVLSLQPGAPAIEYEGQWFSWRQVGGMARRIGSLVDGGQQVGMLLRNRPAHVAALLGVLLSGGCAVVINPSRGDDRTRTDIGTLRLPLLIGEPDDVAALITPSEGTTVVS